MTSDVRAALEAGDDGFHEIQLNGKQLVFLGMATTLVSVVIFLCGVLVGRGVKPLDTVALAGGPQAFDAPVTPSVPPGAITTPAATAPPTPPPSGSGSGSGTAVAAAAAADAGPGDTEPTPLGDEAESPAPAAATAVAPKVATPSPAAPIAPPPAPKLTAAAPAKPETRETVKPAKPAPAQAMAVPPAMAATAPATAGGKIAVQVGAFRTRNEADALAKRLSGRGYAVYVMAPTNDGKNVYRVRVGNYASADEAQRVSAKLTSQEKLKPWVIR